MNKLVTAGALLGCAAISGAPIAARADEAAPSTPAPEAAAPASTAMTTPTMTGPLVANPNPIKFDGGPLNTIYFTGAVSGLGLFQTAPGVAGVKNPSGSGDLSNGTFALQNTDGLVQFFLQVGAYSFPALGEPYFHADKTMGDFFGPIPEGYVKLVPNDALSVQVGKLPTLFGAEYAFSFQNMDIERGLLWNQEPIVSRGVQINYTLGPLALSGSLNDGFYSDSYNWLSGAATWTIDKINSLEVVGGGNFDQTGKNILKTQYFQNNGDIFNIIYTYNNAPWTITPYFQYTNVPGNAFLGSPHGASTYGGAVLASYAINDNVSLAGRWEYITSTGSVTSGAANVLYGPGSSAFSFTFTPTYQLGIGFLRADASVVDLSGTTAGFAFGTHGTIKTQGRFVVEAGVVF